MVKVREKDEGEPKEKSNMPFTILKEKCSVCGCSIIQWHKPVIPEQENPLCVNGSCPSRGNKKLGFGFQ